MSLMVTVVDEQTGEEQKARVVDGDYILVTCWPCHLDGMQRYPAKGTVVLTVKDNRPNQLDDRKAVPT